MRKFKLVCFIFFSCAFINPTLIAQIKVDRQPYAAGRFYENDSTKLMSDLDYLFNTAKDNNLGDVRAIISPHAGFVYSGEVTASAFKQLDPHKKYKNVFVIGSSHTMQLDGASIYALGNYVTPLGKVTVDIDIANQLISENRYISYVPEAHTREHILENQLPFLQYYLKEPFQLIPMVIGTDNEKVLNSIAKTLQPFLNDENLFVISADFSHYPVYRDAQVADSLTARSIITNDPDTFKKALVQNNQAEMPGLVTSTCGSTAIQTLLYMTQSEDMKFVPLQYMNSGDVEMGDKNRVVGYFSLALVQKTIKNEYDFLTIEDKHDLLKVARLTVEEYIGKNEIPQLDPDQFSDNLIMNSGAFVTLNKNHNLRGCIGRFTSDKPLYLLVQEMAIAAATQDYRFKRVQLSELSMVEFEVSVLTPLKKINSIEEIELGRDGIYIVKNSNTGTFLPQVADQTGWTKEEFLGHCSRDKAGIGWDGWKDADIYTYQAIVFSE